MQESIRKAKQFLLRGSNRHLKRKDSPAVIRLFKYIARLTTEMKSIVENQIGEMLMECVRVILPGTDSPRKILNRLTYYNYYLNDGVRTARISQIGKVHTKKMPIEVNMAVAGDKYKFVMETSRCFQIVVHFLDGVKKSYDGIIKDLDGDPAVSKGGGETVGQRNAEAILSALDAPGDEEVDLFRKLSPTERGSAVRLMVFTHLAEGVCPDEKEFRIDVSHFEERTAIRGRKIRPRGGWPGIGKTARGIFREIASGEMTFDAAFNPKSGAFLVARVNGKRQMAMTVFNDENSQEVFPMVRSCSYESPELDSEF